MGGRGEADLVFRIAVHKPHARHAEAGSAKRPCGAAGDLRQQPRRQARRLGQAGPDLPFAPAGDGHVRRQHQCREPRIAGPSQHIGAHLRIPRRIHLKPAM